MPHHSHFRPDFHQAVELIGRRWAGAILREMLGGATRFTELLNAVPEISERMLCARLRGLEEAGLIERRVFGETPVRVEYGLTPKGRDLEEVFLAIAAWADRWVTASSPASSGPAGCEPSHRSHLVGDRPSIGNREEATMTTSTEKFKDPVCGRRIDPAAAEGMVTYQSTEVYFCSEQCRRSFEEEPARYPLERHEPPYTVDKGIAAPKFGSAASGGLEYEPGPERHDKK